MTQKEGLGDRHSCDDETQKIQQAEEAEVAEPTTSHKYTVRGETVIELLPQKTEPLSLFNKKYFIVGAYISVINHLC